MKYDSYETSKYPEIVEVLITIQRNVTHWLQFLILDLIFITRIELQLKLMWLTT